jgi:hypothetical protein
MDCFAILLTIMSALIIYLCIKYRANVMRENFLVDIKKINKASTRDHSILDDPLFADVKEYTNDDDGRLGIDKCLEYCKGGCVEFGQTGIAYCFPRDNPIKANYNTTMRNFENETEDKDRATERIAYPGLR